jgi:hypothetical protein
LETTLVEKRESQCNFCKGFFLEKMAQKSSDLDAKVSVKSPDFRPQFVPLPLAQTQNDDK